MKVRMFPLSLLLLAASSAGAQDPFANISDGSDGALEITENTIWNPFDYDLNQDGELNFTTITIASGATVTMQGFSQDGVVLRAEGAVVISGVIDICAADSSSNTPGAPGLGGFRGGRDGEDGEGPGGGVYDVSISDIGGSGSYGTVGVGDLAGSTYGNSFLQPLLGGSGGAGGEFSGSSFAGGSGGGAILIASETSITLTGQIDADGSRNTSTSNTAGGSGGAIRLYAPSISGTGSLSASGGFPNSSIRAGDGRILIEASSNNFTGFSTPAAITRTPIELFAPSTDAIRVISIGGVPTPDEPTGTFASPDVILNSVGPVTLVLGASGIPLGTELEVEIYPEGFDPINTTSTPLAGTLESSTASVEVTLPRGYSRAFIRAQF